MSEPTPIPQRDQVVRQLRAHWPELRQHGLVHLDLVGSVARDEGHAGSDIDLVADLDPALDLHGFLDVVDRLQLLLGARVDLMSRRGLRTHWRQHFEQGAVHVA